MKTSLTFPVTFFFLTPKLIVFTTSHPHIKYDEAIWGQVTAASLTSSLLLVERTTQRLSFQSSELILQGKERKS